MVYNPPSACPHEVVATFFHEVGHAQCLLLPDVAVMSGGLGFCTVLRGYWHGLRREWRKP